jgi:exonuclease III
VASLYTLTNLNFSAQNCNSLNVSTNCPKQVKKVAAILALQTSIIFLSDLRLNTDVVPFNNLFFPRYSFFHNSKSSKRGVGILINNQLKFSIISEHRDEENNILGLKLNICDCEILLICVYRPNNNDHRFFNDLRHILEVNPDSYIICAGDWNATFSTLPANENIDTINMINPPSLIRSAWIQEICERFHLTDPFRALHYDTREFTYVPNIGHRNRSRIDYFLISDVLIQLCNKCTIASSLDSELFDNKHISLCFSQKNTPTRHVIKPIAFAHPCFRAVVETAAAETYLQHADRDQADLDLDEGLQHIGRLINAIKRCNDLEFEIAFGGDNPDLIRSLEAAREELYQDVDSLPDTGRLNEISLTCTPDVFLEILMGNIRNSLISFQAWIIKVRNAKKNNILQNLYRLKQDYLINCDLIYDLEKQLTKIRDEELNGTVQELKIFEHLHNEKPSPLFLNLVKCSSKNSLDCIVQDNGEVFRTKFARDEFIVNSFAKIYRGRPADPRIDYDSCITQFLGPEVCNHPVVQSSRLTVMEKDDLDRPLSIEELDESLKNCNIRSAAGNDGFSNRLIKLCWNNLRIPLYNYAVHCYNTGILTHNFRSTNIKLIPKKRGHQILEKLETHIFVI